MKANLDELRELVIKGKVGPHNFGPPPEMVIKLFETKPEIWHANLLGDSNMVGNYSIPSIIARGKKGHYVMDSDVQNTIEILGEKFYGADAMKIQGGQEFGGIVRNRPALIFLWWD